MVNIQSFWKVSSVRCIEIDESPEPVVRVVFVWRRSKDLQHKLWCHLCICGRHFAVLDPTQSLNEDMNLVKSSDTFL